MNSLLDWYIDQLRANRAHVEAVREARTTEVLTDEHAEAVGRTFREMMEHSVKLRGLQ